MKPITPAEAIGKRTFPSPVLQAFNDQIKKNMNGKVSTFLKKDVVAAICKLMCSKKGALGDSTRRSIEETIYKEKWLDVEDLYRGFGWEVEYDGPGYNETYEGKFIFRVKDSK